MAEPTAWYTKDGVQSLEVEADTGASTGRVVDAVDVQNHLLRSVLAAWHLSSYRSMCPKEQVSRGNLSENKQIRYSDSYRCTTVSAYEAIDITVWL